VFSEQERCAIVPQVNIRSKLSRQTHVLSIMSYNILWEKESKCTWKDRMPTLLKALEQRAPDIICMQEVGHDMYRDLQVSLV
jgi:mRNA deadenylase 3'-5' endonuclease subunit Ccr4